MDLKNFEKYLKLCRKYGVEELKIGEVSLKLGSEIPKSAYKAKQEDSSPIKVIPQYSDMDALMWSTGGVPPVNEVDNG